MKSDMRMLRPFVLALFAALPAAYASAADTLSGDDQEFLRKAAIGGMTEVQAGQAAQKQASMDDVRQLASTMVTDHTKANEELKGIASKNGWNLPAQLDSEHQDKLNALVAKKGNDFDEDYADSMVKDHKDTIELFKKESEHGQVAALRDFAKKTLPTLEHHLKMSQDVDKKVDKR